MRDRQSQKLFRGLTKGDGLGKSVVTGTMMPPHSENILLGLDAGIRPGWEEAIEPG